MRFFMTNEIMKILDGEIFSVWFLIGAAFVFWMQAGFAMCEAGFTRAKNAGNIIMKNLMDFCIGTVMWFICGASFMLGKNVLNGFSGGLSFDVFTHYSSFDYSAFIFNLVFCATTAKNQVLQLLYLLCSHFRYHLSHRSPLDMGRRLSGSMGIS